MTDTGAPSRFQEVSDRHPDDSDGCQPSKQPVYTLGLKE